MENRLGQAIMLNSPKGRPRGVQLLLGELLHLAGAEENSAAADLGDGQGGIR